MNPFMAPRADMGQAGLFVKAVAAAATPGAHCHPFRDRLAAIDTGVHVRQDISVAFSEGLASEYLPVRFALAK